MHQFKNVYISGIGVYIPPFRIKADKIAKAHNQNGESISSSLGVLHKSVADKDEDSITMAITAAQKAIKNSKINPQDIKALFIGSESHPYAVKPSGTVVASWLNLSPNLYCADLEFACKAGTAGLQIVASMIESGMIENGLVIGTDKAQSKPADALEYTAASSAVAIVLSKKSGIAKLHTTHTYTTDTPDFWRREGQKYPKHAGRFTGEPAYFKHVLTTTQQLLELINKKVSDIDHFIFHMPNAKFPQKAAQNLQIPTEKIETGLTVKFIGNSYSSSSLLGLARVLAHSSKNQKIILTSYGSGSGSDSFFITKISIPDSSLIKDIEKQLTQEINLTYLKYLKNMGILNL
jgi:hydroxymethylglutaryl-CoA synthase